MVLINEAEVAGQKPVGEEWRLAGTSQLEHVVRRARRIHREHGGLFGYDFDDWAQAWEELSPKEQFGGTKKHVRVASPANVGLTCNQDLAADS